MNILVLTPQFPLLDHYHVRSEDPASKFLFDYIKEWVNDGNSVCVIHSPPVYPRLFQKLLCLQERVRLSRFSSLKRYKQRLELYAEKNYVKDEIYVKRIPLYKMIPHREYPASYLRKSKKKVIEYVLTTGMKFDVVFADYISPSLSLSIPISQKFKVPLNLILHNTDISYLEKHKKRYVSKLEMVDRFLFRSFSIKEQFLQKFHVEKSSEVFLSGVPDEVKLGFPRAKINKFLFVGTLRKEKNIQFTLRAIYALKRKGITIQFQIVGSGEYENELRELVEKLCISNQVEFLGNVEWNNVFKIMELADVFVMVSKETFGMVYVEAMSQGCIVVAGKGEGIDGIVKSGENGFLVPIEDVTSLVSIIEKILKMDSAEIQEISIRAIQTASNMRNSYLAKKVLY